MPVSCLVLCINRDSQRLDGVHVKGGHLFDVPQFFGLSLFDVCHTLFVEKIQQVNRDQDKSARQDKREALVLHCGIEKNGGSSAGKFSGECPDHCLLAWQVDQVALIDGQETIGTHCSEEVLQ